MIREVRDQNPTFCVAPHFEHSSLASWSLSLVWKTPESFEEQKAIEAWSHYFKEPQIDAIVLTHEEAVYKVALTEDEPWVNPSYPKNMSTNLLLLLFAFLLCSSVQCELFFIGGADGDYDDIQQRK